MSTLVSGYKRGPPSAPAGHLSGVTPDGHLYWDDSVLRTELDRFYYRNWLLVGREEQLPKTGDYLARTIGTESIALVRDKEGQVRGFQNVCRHRGTQLLEEPCGSGLKSIVCPYHAWTYALDGRLTGAGHMGNVQGFSKEDNSLFPIRVESAAGFLWANLDPKAGPLTSQLGPFLSRIAQFSMAQLRAGPTHTYTIEANWKLLVENYSECYHCAPIHPELNRITPYNTGDNDAFFTEGKGKFSGGYQTFAGDYTSMTLSGYTRRPPLPGMTDEDRKRIYYYVLWPNTFFSLHPDYLMVHRAWPISPHQSLVENDFYFDPQAMAQPDFDPSDAVQIWDTINKQDWHVCELAQKGTRSRNWHGGRYSEQETLVWDFDAYYQEQMGRNGP
ncbi:MAG: aromatic ring-hydroxylating dioxygenase subunit alpha [Thermoplasmata archaeon]|nr:aromatic ring-hydroxylating dioxygenase subunit alpha [Thermoplasmata archaeon]